MLKKWTEVVTSAQDPTNFDADPDPGFALEKNGFRLR